MNTTLRDLAPLLVIFGLAALAGAFFGGPFHVGRLLLALGLLGAAYAGYRALKLTARSSGVTTGSPSDRR